MVKLGRDKKKEEREKERLRLERDERIAQMKARIAKKKFRKIRKVMRIPKTVKPKVKKILKKIKKEKNVALRTTHIMADTLKELMAKDRSQFSAKIVKVVQPAMTFKRQWKLLYESNQLSNYARWVALIVAYCFVNLATLFLAAYSYFMSMSEPYKYMENFVSFGKEHGQNLVFFCIQSAIVSFHGFSLSCAALDVVRRNNLKFFALIYLVHASVHLIFLVLITIMYVVGWLHVKRFLQNGDYLYDPLRLYSEEQDIFVSTNEFQIKYSCCGIKNYLDWAKVKWWTGEYSPVQTINSLFKVPFSCCDQDLAKSGTCIWFAQATLDLTINRHGCRAQVKEFLKSELFIKMILLIVMTCCHAMCFLFLYPSVKNLPAMELRIFKPPKPQKKDKEKEKAWITNTLAQLFSKNQTAVRTSEAKKLVSQQSSGRKNQPVTGTKALILNMIKDREKLEQERHDFQEREYDRKHAVLVKDARLV